MRKFYSFCASLLVASTMMAGAQALSDTQTLWGNVFKNSNISGTNPTSGGYGLVSTTDGNVVTLGNVGSKSDTESLLWGDEVIGVGTQYGGNSCNYTLNITKVNADNGQLVWNVYSTAGEMGESAIAATADGGVVAFVGLRQSEGYLDNGIHILDTKGVDHEVAGAVEERSYVPVVLKLDADGAVEWLKVIDVNTTADPETYPGWTESSRHIGQGVYTYAIEVDNAGNIFLGGGMNAAMTIDNVTITPHNVSDWTGKTQGASNRKNLFIVKLDSDGNYVKHIVTGGEAAKEDVRMFKVVGNKLYVLALITGKADSAFSLGDYQATPSVAYESIATACLDTDLNVDWFRFYESTLSGSTMQMPTIAAISGKLYVMGTAKMGVKVDDKEFKTANARDPWLMQVDATNGDILNVLTYKDTQHGFFGAYQGVDGNIYAIERGLGSLNPNVNNNLYNNQDMNLHQIDPEALTSLDHATLITKAADGYGIVATGNKLYTFNRMVNGNKAVSYINSSLTFTSSAFLSQLSAFQMPAAMGTVESVAIDGEEEISVADGPVQLTATVLPAGMTNKDIIWSSSDENVITVSENGLVREVTPQSAAQRAARAQMVTPTAVITATSAANPALKASVVAKGTAVKTGITEVEAATTTKDSNIYTIDGRLLKQGTDVTNLPAGLYIVGGKKVLVK